MPDALPAVTEPSFLNTARSLRFPQASPIKWDEDLEDYTVTIHHGLGGRSDVILGGCKVNGFVLEMKEGGTVALTCRVQCKPDEKQSGRLCMLVQTDCDISLAPPEEAE